MDTVAVFVNATLKQLTEIAATGLFNWVQLHGDETPSFCRKLTSLNIQTIKAIRVRKKYDVLKGKKYFTDAILLDAYLPEKYGGTGKTFDWNMVEHINKRVFLAGGITPENVRQAVETGLYGIDVCSGVEASPGKKDRHKMEMLFKNIRELGF